VSKDKSSSVFKLIACLVAGASVAALPAAGTSTENRVIIKPSPDANTAFTPLVLPRDAAQRGISLSGEAQLYRLEPAHYRLDRGCILVHTEETIAITTCFATILVRKGATIIVSIKNDVTRVLNLSDRKRDSVRIIFSKNHISLSPGEELAVAGSRIENADSAAMEDVIRYRNVQKVPVCPKCVALYFEFSLLDAIKHHLIFRQLSESNRVEDKALLAEIIKTAAAVDTIFEKSRDKYKHSKDKASAPVQENQPQRKRKMSARATELLK
jgi:hypothetical protein